MELSKEVRRPDPSAYNNSQQKVSFVESTLETIRHRPMACNSENANQSSINRCIMMAAGTNDPQLAEKAIIQKYLLQEIEKRKAEREKRKAKKTTESTKTTKARRTTSTLIGSSHQMSTSSIPRIDIGKVNADADDADADHGHDHDDNDEDNNHDDDEEEDEDDDDHWTSMTLTSAPMNKYKQNHIDLKMPIELESTLIQLKSGIKLSEFLRNRLEL